YDISGSAPQHFLGFAPDGHHFAAGLVNGHDRRLIHHNAFAVREHQSVRGAQIDGEVGRKQTEHRPHVVTVLVHPYIPLRRKTLRCPAGNSTSLPWPAPSAI